MRKKNIKYEKLSKEIKHEIEIYFKKKKGEDKELTVEDAMVKWFSENFEEWIKHKYSADKEAEKRRYYRIDIEIPVKIVDTLIESSNGDAEVIGIVGTIINISRGGLFFKSDRHFEPSSILMARIDLSAVDGELKDVDALAMVMRSEKISDGEYGIGVMFSSIYDEHKENLDLFVFKNLAYYIYSI
ncbi:MAG: PilZ domain-containing protein [Spirochaetes bacterium]|jgi:hypothetical protein|nr:PilZ domain-containing protein [Spirochaetota bacterium]